MGILVQVRDVPPEVHRRLKARAALKGVSLSEYLRTLLTQSASRPTPDEFAARIAQSGPVTLHEPSELIVRRLRDEGE